MMYYTDEWPPRPSGLRRWTLDPASRVRFPSLTSWLVFSALPTRKSTFTAMNTAAHFDTTATESTDRRHDRRDGHSLCDFRIAECMSFLLHISYLRVRFSISRKGQVSRSFYDDNKIFGTTATESVDRTAS